MHASGIYELASAQKRWKSNPSSPGSVSGPKLYCPSQLGPYRILRPLGRGGSARVFLAETKPTSGLSPLVALKVIVPDEKGRNLSLLWNEETILNPLRHPNIVRFHTVGETDGLAYGVLDLIDGWTLKELLKMERKIPLSICLDFGLQVCSALAYLHHSGPNGAPIPVVHSDLKPSNILIDRFGRVTLIDFGIACELGRQKTGCTHSGTAAYMAPEQVIRGRLDGRTDLYALGVVLYEMVTGMRLFPGSDVPKLLQGRMRAVSLPKTGFIHGVLGDPLHYLMRALQVALECDPNDRYPSARHFAAALRSVQRKVGAYRSSELWVQRTSKCWQSMG